MIKQRYGTSFSCCCLGAHICHWLESILDDTNAGHDADWLSMHRYFSDYGRSWVRHFDSTPLGGNPSGQGSTYSTHRTHYPGSYNSV